MERHGVRENAEGHQSGQSRLPDALLGHSIGRIHANAQATRRDLPGRAGRQVSGEREKTGECFMTGDQRVS